MVDLRDEIDSVVPTSFAFAQDFMFWEEFGIIKRELLRNVVIGKSKGLNLLQQNEFII